MKENVIKEALSYDLGADLHEGWRSPRKLPDGSFEPRVKKSKDESWNAIHGTDEVDIANCSFSELPSNWQFENLEAARVVIELVYEKVMSGIEISEEEVEKMSDTIHSEWLKRNQWVLDPQNGNSALAVPYEQLSEEEKEKDRIQLTPAIKKVTEYKSGLIDIDSIIKEYGIDTESKSL